MTKLIPIVRRSVAATLFTAAFALATPPTDFTVEAPAGGTKFHLADAKGKYVALHFLLKTECPICLRHTRNYAKKAALRPDVVQVFLKPDSAGDIKNWTAQLGDETVGQVTIYRDPEAALAKAFAIPDGYHFHGEVTHFPALVLLDPAGKEVFRYVGKDNTDRFGFEQLTAKLAELKKAGKGTTPPATDAK